MDCMVFVWVGLMYEILVLYECLIINNLLVDIRDRLYNNVNLG